uniref:Uncharacterized protein n=1 Tax=Panagrolaimus davidi TaxID=227884 RepID=A0A914Q3I7_9BILA
MSNENNSSSGRQLGEDDARALFNAVIRSSIRNLLIEEGQQCDASLEPPDDDWNFQPFASTSRGNFLSSATRGFFQASSTRGLFYLSTSRAAFEERYYAPPSYSHGSDYMADTHFSCAIRNPYTPVERRAIYDRALGPNAADGMRKIECDTPLIKVKK